MNIRMDNKKLARLLIVVIGVTLLMGATVIPAVYAQDDGDCDPKDDPGCDESPTSDESAPTVNDDRDGDGTDDFADRCPDVPGPAFEPNFGCPDDDLDGDGVPLPTDLCPEEAAFGTVNGCYDTPADDPNTDGDGDGVFDDADQCPDFAGSPEFNGCQYLNDSDGDAVDDTLDVCPGFDDNADADGDGTPDGCEPDSDGDGIIDDNDICPSFDDNVDADGDGTPDGCDDDRDGDGVANADDSCPDLPGVDNRFLRGCPPLPELLAIDDDGDGIFLPDDECPLEQGLPENNGCPATPVDSDGDGIPDDVDQCDEVVGTAEAMGCQPRPVITVTVPDDSDGDSVPDGIDRCPYTFGAPGNDGCPPDSDGDGIVNLADGCPLQAGPRSNNGCPEPTTNIYSDVVVTDQRVCTSNHTIAAVIRADNNRAWRNLMPTPPNLRPSYVKIEVVTTAGTFTVSAPVFGPVVRFNEVFQSISMEGLNNLPDDAEILQIIPPANFSVREQRSSITTASYCGGGGSLSLFDYVEQTGSYEDIVVEGELPSTGGCKKNNGFHIIFGC